MTIDSAWVEILKGLVPGAFSLEPPFVPECVFIDGMLLLMKAKHIRSWDQLIDFNFCRHIRKYMNMGATTVVVGFDVYYHVPTSKSITQVNRAKAKAQVDFEESTNLPPLIPDNYEDCMSNRAFKIKVITKVVESLESMLDLPTGKRLVIDYQNYPVVSERFYRRGEVMEPVPGSRDGAKRPTIFRYMVQDVPDMGECDIKAWRWADMMGDCYAHSKDGDYIPISLIHFEKAVRRGCKPPKMAIVRGEYVSPTSRKEAGDKKNGRKNVEYVDVSKLYEGVRAFLLSRTVPACARQECSRRADVCMQALVVLIGLGGTDFSRTLPRIGPKTLWKTTIEDPVAFSELVLSIDAESECGLDIMRLEDGFLARILRLVFQKHVMCRTIRPTLSEVVDSIQSSSSVSEKVKQAMNCLPRMRCTLRNILWINEYWQCRQPAEVSPLQGSSGAEEEEIVWDRDGSCPNPIAETYGFSATNKGKVKWWDEHVKA